MVKYKQTIQIRKCAADEAVSGNGVQTRGSHDLNELPVTILLFCQYRCLGSYFKTSKQIFVIR